MIIHTNQEPTKPSRVLLLGATGFIGAVIQQQLESAAIPTVALGSADINLLEPSASDRLGELLSPDDSVVMLAALTPDKGRNIATLMKNLVMMQTVCEALEKSGCGHLVYFSSDAVYGTGVSQVTEDTPVAPEDLYGAMHYTREIMIRSLAAVPVIVFRPTGVYGRDDTHNSYGPNRFRKAAQADGKITLFGGGEETRDHIYVDDVAALTIRCLLQKSTGTLNVATGISTSFHEVAETISKQFGGGIEIIITPRANPITHRHYDPTNLIKAFPDFSFMPLVDGIALVHKESSMTA
ncbi:MAG: NAD(P)-dependent oxidoreductase [SAR202 cluster bacterium]|nr:NAD(P)-dependent oxidoreductase [SAR202 cluster bacterium]